MKKKFIGVLAALLVLCSGTTVFAAETQFPSSSGDSTLEELEKLEQDAKESTDAIEQDKSTGAVVKNADGTTSKVDVSYTALEAENYQNAKQTLTSEGKNGTILASADVKVVPGTDISKGITVTIYSASLAESARNDKVIMVKHFLESVGKWDTVAPDVVGDGYLKVTFYSLSPVAVVAYPAGTVVAETKLDVNQQIAELESSNAALTGQITNLQEANSALSGQVTSLQNANATLSEQIAGLNATLTDLDKKLAAAEEDAKETDKLKEQISDVKIQLATLSGQLAAMGDKTDDALVTALQAQITALQTQVASLQTAVAALPASSVQTGSSDSSNAGTSNSTSSADNKQTVNVNVTGNGQGNSGGSNSSTSPKTGSSMPVLPMLLGFGCMSLVAAYHKKAINL